MLQRLDQLIEKTRDPVLEFRWRRRWNGPHFHFHSAAADELFAVLGNEFVKHCPTTAFLTFYVTIKKRAGPETFWKGAAIRFGGTRGDAVETNY